MRENFSKLYSAELEGINARVIEIEVDLNVGLHAFTIVGLADKALNEARERVNSALKNSHIKPPNQENRRITVNLAPAEVRKTGAHYDLAIALGYLLATQQIKKFETGDKIFLGELALDGSLRPIRGALNIAELTKRIGCKSLFLPAQNAREAAVIQGITIVPAQTLQEVIDILEGKKSPGKISDLHPQSISTHASIPDFSEIKGQDHAKRALIISAIGGHNILMTGPPGVGKSLLAQAVPGILPDLSIKESIEVTKIYSAAAARGISELITRRPFRMPHQSSSLVALIGGGSEPRPGEISLAHRGVLFLDELPEFQRQILESLRQPLEMGVVAIARAKGILKFPSRFILIAAMNPCPCGFYGDPEKECVCHPSQILHYQRKISGPLLDRIDMQIKLNRIDLALLREDGVVKEKSLDIKEKIVHIISQQKKRYKKFGLRLENNAQMSSRQVNQVLVFTPAGERFISLLQNKDISPRAYYRILKVARTIADFDDVDLINDTHLAEAFSYRIHSSH